MSKKIGVLIGTAVTVLVIVLAGACSWSGSGKREYPFAEDAKDGGYIHPSPTPGQNQEQKEPSYFTIEVNAGPTVSGGGKRCNLMIGNPAGNEQYVKVKLVLDATGEVLFFSELLKPGERNAYVDLEQVPEAGEHAATAVFMVYDPECMEQISEIDAGVLLTVQK